VAAALRTAAAARKVGPELQPLWLGLLDGMTAHVAMLDLDGTILAVNAAWRRFAGDNSVSGAGLLEGTNYLQVCDRADATAADATDATAFAVGLREVLEGRREVFVYEYPCHTANEQRWFAARITRVSYGGRLFVMVSHENITDRKRVESALQQSRRRVSDVLESIPDGFFALDEAWRCSYLNRAAERFLGRPRDAVFGRYFWEAFPEEEHSTTAAEFRRARVTGAAARFEKYQIAAGCWVEFDACPGDGGLFVHVRDVSERRAAREAEARAQAERLEQLEREVGTLREILARPGEAPVVLGGGAALQSAAPEAFKTWVVHYGKLMDEALEQRFYKVRHDTSAGLRALAERMGTLGSGADGGRGRGQGPGLHRRGSVAGAGVDGVSAVVLPPAGGRGAVTGSGGPSHGRSPMSVYLLKLYVTGQTPRSQRAITNLRRICEDELQGRYDMQVIDVLERPQLAEDEKILATPTVVKELPMPIRRIIGDLSDADKVLVGLDLQTVPGKPNTEEAS
jgi:circadian clock protein KaiB